MPYDMSMSEARGTPHPLVRYVGDQAQIMAGLGFGPGGLYFAPMLPNRSGITAILKGNTIQPLNTPL